MKQAAGMTIADALERIAELPELIARLERIAERGERTWPKTLSIKQAGEYLGISEDTVRKHLVATGLLPVLKIGSDTRIAIEALDEYRLSQGVRTCHERPALVREVFGDSSKQRGGRPRTGARQ